jgi:hypothetical protein
MIRRIFAVWSMYLALSCAGKAAPQASSGAGAPGDLSDASKSDGDGTGGAGVDASAADGSEVGIAGDTGDAGVRIITGFWQFPLEDACLATLTVLPKVDAGLSDAS